MVAGGLSGGLLLQVQQQASVQQGQRLSVQELQRSLVHEVQVQQGSFRSLRLRSVVQALKVQEQASEDLEEAAASEEEAF